MIFDYILAVIATYRIALAIATEEGPGIPFGTEEKKKEGIFLRFREWIDPTGQQETWLARGVNCPHCVGLYPAFAFAVLITSTIEMFFLTWFAIAGGQSLLQSVMDKWNS